ncbi:Fur family transcriptional regulator, ferric uptake regulator [Actinacidiphila rubida]|uniref:Fur family transcriptional regulator, ferric uptake regulator n=2 Tax=Actinacidiphila rubida TaxID=310780 RepID=A0A1H8MVL9_9ACTN|nr:Fur family transcriptional regulator, ferric uptake regulator [Actinacidiphila rubida]
MDGVQVKKDAKRITRRVPDPDCQGAGVHDPNQVNEMSDLLERLRGRGWRMTSQRRVVAEVLDGDHVHLTADEVHARAARRLPEISRATVYNTLGELVQLGEVMEVATDGRAKRYDPNAHRPHQHLVCSGCGSIRDVRPAGDPLADLPAEERFGFRVSAVQVTYRGLCPDCA